MSNTKTKKSNHKHEYKIVKIEDGWFTHKKVCVICDHVHTRLRIEKEDEMDISNLGRCSNLGRVTEKFINGEWIEVNFTSLREGDSFRHIDDGVTWVSKNGESVFTATSNPFIDEDGYWRIRIE